MMLSRNVRTNCCTIQPMLPVMVDSPTVYYFLVEFLLATVYSACFPWSVLRWIGRDL